MSRKQSKSSESVISGAAAVAEAQTQLSRRRIFGAWAAEAQLYLDAIVTDDFNMKRRTLAALAAAKWDFEPQTEVFSRPETSHLGTHYKWLKTDSEYAAAHAFLIGTADNPGVVLQAMNQHYAEAELNAIQRVEKSRITIRAAVPEAVSTLIAGLLASDKRGPDWRSRIEAAQTLIRLAHETAGDERESGMHVNINQAILHVYGKDTELPVNTGATELTASGERRPGESLSNKGDVIDGTFSETSFENTAETLDSDGVSSSGEPFPPTHPMGSTPTQQGSLAAEGNESATDTESASNLVAALDKVPESQRTAVLALLQAHTTHTNTTNDLSSAAEQETGEKRGGRGRAGRERTASEQTGKDKNPGAREK
jgi:hypothetical protein